MPRPGLLCDAPFRARSIHGTGEATLRSSGTVPSTERKIAIVIPVTGDAVDGTVYWRGEDGYEPARVDAVWHQRKPDRYPAVVVVPASEQGVLDAVNLARDRGLRIKACSGGHSFTCSSH